MDITPYIQDHRVYTTLPYRCSLGSISTTISTIASLMITMGTYVTTGRSG